MLFMRRRNSLGHLNGNADGFLNLQPPFLLNIAFQGNALDQFHDYVMEFSLIDNVVNTDNVRMGQSGCRLSLHLKLADKIAVIAEFFLQDLDGHQAVQLMAFCFIYHRHAAGADLL